MHNREQEREKSIRGWITTKVKGGEGKKMRREKGEGRTYCAGAQQKVSN
jgi:hypothetical protein